MAKEIPKFMLPPEDPEESGETISMRLPSDIRKKAFSENQPKKNIEIRGLTPAPGTAETVLSPVSDVVEIGDVDDEEIPLHGRKDSFIENVTGETQIMKPKELEKLQIILDFKKKLDKIVNKINTKEIQFEDLEAATEIASQIEVDKLGKIVTADLDLSRHGLMVIKDLEEKILHAVLSYNIKNIEDENLEKRINELENKKIHLYKILNALNESIKFKAEQKSEVIEESEITWPNIVRDTKKDTGGPKTKVERIKGINTK